jgi:hypothetical protein
MKKRLLSALSALTLVAGYSGLATAGTPDVSPGPIQHQRVCDQPMTWQYKVPATDVPAKYIDLMGLWTGEVNFVGGGSMCIAVVVSEVSSSGDINTVFAWNLGNSLSGEIFNVHSQGTVTWSAKSAKVGPKGEEMIVFSSNDPYHGLTYEYRFSFPRKDRMVGALISHKPNGTTTSSDAAVLTRNMPAAPSVAAPAAPSVAAAGK